MTNYVVNAEQWLRLMDIAAQRPDRWWMLLSWIGLFVVFAVIVWILWNELQKSRRANHEQATKMTSMLLESHQLTAQSVNKLETVAHAMADVAGRRR
jgi:type II secretory pathway component PulM